MKKILAITTVSAGILVLAFGAIQQANQENNRQAVVRDAPYAKIAEQSVIITSGKTQLKQAQDTAEATNAKLAAVCKWASTTAAQSRIPKVSVPAECSK